MPSPSNRRTGERKALRAAARILAAHGEHDVRLHDLGADGAALMSTRPVAQGSKVWLSFELWTPQGPRPIKVSAKVVYSTYLAREEFKIGTLFTALEPDDVVAIREYLE